MKIKNNLQQILIGVGSGVMTFYVTKVLDSKNLNKVEVTHETIIKNQNDLKELLTKDIEISNNVEKNMKLMGADGKLHLPEEGIKLMENANNTSETAKNSCETYFNYNKTLSEMNGSQISGEIKNHLDKLGQECWNKTIDSHEALQKFAEYLNNNKKNFNLDLG